MIKYMVSSFLFYNEAMHWCYDYTIISPILLNVSSRMSFRDCVALACKAWTSHMIENFATIWKVKICSVSNVSFIITCSANALV